MGLFDFLKKNKNIENENGLNELYSNKGKGVLKARFYKKNGILNGLHEQFHYEGILDQRTNYKNGKKHGRWEMYLAKDFDGDKVSGVYLFAVGNFENGNRTKAGETYDKLGGGKVTLENGDQFWYSSKDILKTYNEVLLELKKIKQEDEKVLKKLKLWDLQMEQKKAEGTYDDFIKKCEENYNVLYALHVSQKKQLESSIKENKKEMNPFLINNFAFIKDTNIINSFGFYKVYSGELDDKKYINGKLNKSNEIFGDIPDELKDELADLKKGILPTKKTAKKKENKNRSKKSKYNNSKWWKDKFKEDDCLDYSHYYLRLVRRIFLDPDGTVRLFRADELEIGCGDDGSNFFPNLVIGHSKEDKEPHIIENCPAYFIGGVDDSVGTLGEGSLDEIIEILTQIETYDYEDILEDEKNDFYLFTKKKK